MSLLLSIAFLGFTFLGPTNDISRYVSVILFIIWLLFILFTNNSCFMSALSSPQAIALFTSMFFIFATGIFKGGLTLTLKNSIYQLIIFSPIIINRYYKTASKTKYKLLLQFSIILIIFTIIVAGAFYITNPGAARMLVRDENAYKNIAIGGDYGLAYASTVFAIYLIDLLLNITHLNPEIKFLILFLIILNIFIVYKTESTTTLVVLVSGLLLSFILRHPSKALRKKSIKNSTNYSTQLISLFKAISVLLITVIFLINFQNIGYWIIEQTTGKSDVYSLRIYQIGLYMVEGLNEANYLNYRLSRLPKSFFSFVESPLIGKGIYYGYDNTKSLPYIGGHSEWFDALGKYGMLGSIPYFLIYFFTIKEERKYSKGFIPPTYLWGVFTLGLFNPFHSFQPMMVLMIVIPSISYFLFRKNYLFVQ